MTNSVLKINGIMTDNLYCFRLILGKTVPLLINRNISGPVRSLKNPRELPIQYKTYELFI